MAQKALTKTIGFAVGFTLVYFASNLVDQVRLNIPRYPSYSCLIEQAKPGQVVPAVVYVLGKINWKERKYSIDDKSNLGISFYYSWSRDFKRIDCGEINE